MPIFQWITPGELVRAGVAALNETINAAINAAIGQDLDFLQRPEIVVIQRFAAQEAEARDRAPQATAANPTLPPISQDLSGMYDAVQEVLKDGRPKPQKKKTAKIVSRYIIENDTVSDLADADEHSASSATLATPPWFMTQYRLAKAVDEVATLTSEVEALKKSLAENALSQHSATTVVEVTPLTVQKPEGASETEKTSVSGVKDQTPPQSMTQPAAATAPSGADLELENARYVQQQRQIESQRESLTHVQSENAQLSAQVTELRHQNEGLSVDAEQVRQQMFAQSKLVGQHLASIEGLVEQLQQQKADAALDQAEPLASMVTREGEHQQASECGNCKELTNLQGHMEASRQEYAAVVAQLQQSSADKDAEISQIREELRQLHSVSSVSTPMTSAQSDQVEQTVLLAQQRQQEIEALQVVMSNADVRYQQGRASDQERVQSLLNHQSTMESTIVQLRAQSASLADQVAKLETAQSDQTKIAAAANEEHNQQTLRLQEQLTASKAEAEAQSVEMGKLKFAYKQTTAQHSAERDLRVKVEGLLEAKSEDFNGAAAESHKFCNERNAILKDFELANQECFRLREECGKLFERVKHVESGRDTLHKEKLRLVDEKTRLEEEKTNLLARIEDFDEAERDHTLREGQLNSLEQSAGSTKKLEAEIKSWKRLTHDRQQLVNQLKGENENLRREIEQPRDGKKESAELARLRAQVVDEQIKRAKAEERYTAAWKDNTRLQESLNITRDPNARTLRAMGVSDQTIEDIARGKTDNDEAMARVQRDIEQARAETEEARRQTQMLTEEKEVTESLLKAANNANEDLRFLMKSMGALSVGNTEQHHRPTSPESSGNRSQKRGRGDNDDEEEDESDKTRRPVAPTRDPRLVRHKRSRHDPADEDKMPSKAAAGDGNDHSKT